MACPPYSAPAGDSISVQLPHGYVTPAGDSLAVILDPCGEAPQPAGPLQKSIGMPFRRARANDCRSLDSAWTPTPRIGRQASSAWNAASPSSTVCAAAWSPNARTDRQSSLVHQPARAYDQGCTFGWDRRLPGDVRRDVGWDQSLRSLDLGTAGAWHRVFPRDVVDQSGWEPALLPARWWRAEAREPYVPPGGEGVVVVLQPGTYVPPAALSVTAELAGPSAPPLRIVLRQDPSALRLLWTPVGTRDAIDRLPWGWGSYPGRDPLVSLPWVDDPPDPPPQPPSLKVHIVMNNVTVVRLPDLAPIEVVSVDLSANVDTWCWSVRMELADPSQLVLLLPDGSGPRMVQITMNSYVWTAIIEGRERTRGFGQTSITVAGRSRTALLDAPYAPRRASAEANPRTARQLAEAELVNTGFGVDWAGADWLVPGGAWYYADLTPAAVLTDIASAAGAVLQSHPADATFQVKPRYPVAPWGWASAQADLVLPASWIGDDRTQYASKPMYDAVFVRGEQQGIEARITRQGSAGETFAEQLVHKLITHADVAVQRGTAALSDRGEQELVDVQIPLFVPGPDTGGASGLYLPLNLVEVQDLVQNWRGLSVGVSISARRTGADSAALEVWQNVSIERHLTDAG